MNPVYDCIYRSVEKLMSGIAVKHKNNHTIYVNMRFMNMVVFFFFFLLVAKQECWEFLEETR